MSYVKLHNSLAAGRWREAEYETQRVMSSYLSSEVIARLSCTDLLFKIDEPWVRYSSGRFGFSTQFKIYYDSGVNPNVHGVYQWADQDDKLYRFFDLVGWLGDGDGILYEDLIFDLSAPSGHLPALVYWQDVAFSWEGELLRYFFSQFWNCVGQTVRKDSKGWGHLEPLRKL